MRRINLSTDKLHFSAAASYGRARVARKMSALFPHNAERELKCSRDWIESAEFWRAEARRCSPSPAIIEETRWLTSPTWEQELELLFGCPAAIAAEVE